MASQTCHFHKLSLSSLSHQKYRAKAATQQKSTLEVEIKSGSFLLCWLKLVHTKYFAVIRVNEGALMRVDILYLEIPLNLMYNYFARYTSC